MQRPVLCWQQLQPGSVGLSQLKIRGSWVTRLTCEYLLHLIQSLTGMWYTNSRFYVCSRLCVRRRILAGEGQRVLIGGAVAHRPAVVWELWSYIFLTKYVKLQQLVGTASQAGKLDFLGREYSQQWR